jgi:hypothetical protein
MPVMMLTTLESAPVQIPAVSGDRGHFSRPALENQISYPLNSALVHRDWKRVNYATAGPQHE